MNLAHQLERQALSAPHRPALHLGAICTATYGQWAMRAAALAGHLHAAGLVPGDRVVLFLRNHPRYLELLFGAWWAGLVVVPVNAKLHSEELRWIVANAQARWVFFSADVLPGGAAELGDVQAAAAGAGGSDADAGAVVWVETAIDVDSPACDALLALADTLPNEAPVATPNTTFTLPAITPRGPHDTAWLFYTSGTTGRPKGVCITHQNLLTMGMGYFVDVDPVGPQDAIVYAAPMSHGAGLYAIPHLMAGARHVVPASGGMEPAELFALGREVGPLSMFAAPTIVKRLVDHALASGETPESCTAAFKTIVYGGAPMYAADIQRALRVMGPRFVQIYGQGETPMVATALSRACLADSAHPRYAERIASVGRAQTPVRIRVAGPGGEALPPGEVGEVLVQGASVMAGYWRNPEASAAALREGWLWTGDMGSLDAEGFLTLKDRSKDLIISGGSNIYPREVEEVLLRHPGVAEVAVVGAPHPEWGEEVVACVVARPGLPPQEQPTEAALDALCLRHIARFKRPKRYRWLAELPKNHYGKVLKTVLRQEVGPAPGGLA